MSNLAYDTSDHQGEVVPFPKKERQVMSTSFDKGFIPSSRLYRLEVRPFLSSAAKDIYAELEDHINGYKDKVTDHVSYTQLQGGKLEGANKLSTATVRKGLKELLELGVISIVSESSRKGNEYRINEVSLVERFKNKSTTLETKALHKVKRQHFSNESASTLETKDTIELLNRIINTEEEEEAHEGKFEPQNRQLGFIEYFPSDRQAISFKNLCQKYFAESDFFEQAKITFPNHTAEQIQSEFQKLAQWSLSASSQMPQKWMNVWLNWMQKVPTAQELAKRQAKKSNQSPKPHRFGQSKPTIRDVGGSHE